MESKFVLALQLAFDLLAGFLILALIFRKNPMTSGFKEEKSSSMEEIEEKLFVWERTGRELLTAIEIKLQKMASLSEELDRAEMRATETLERLQRAKEALLCAEGAYTAAFELVRKGLPLREVAKRSGLGLAEVSFIKEVISKDPIPRRDEMMM